jgi:hypothetical protein
LPATVEWEARRPLCACGAVPGLLNRRHHSHGHQQEQGCPEFLHPAVLFAAAESCEQRRQLQSRGHCRPFPAAVVILLVLFGSSLTAFVVAPALTAAVRLLHQSSRRGAGELGEILFFLVLGGVVFWLYYRLSFHGAVSIVPPGWRN